MFRTDDGVALPYEAQGDGIPLILVNGLPDTRAGWRETAAALAPYFRVVTYDLRNQGPVENGGEGYDMERHVLDFAQLLGHLGIDRFVGVGLSMGARLLADFAGAQGERVLRLVLAGASSDRLAPRYRAIFRSWLRALHSAPPDDLTSFVEAFVTWALDPAFLAGDPNFFSRYAKVLAAAHSRRGLAANITALITSYELDYVRKFRLKRIAARTHFIQGEFDFLTPPQFLREMVEIFPHSSLAVIPGSGHNVRIAAPLRLQQEILDFLIRDDELMEYEP